MGSNKPRGNVRRVNAKHPCRICGHPDWCLYTGDGEVSICARVTDGATKVNGRGEGIFVHQARDLKNYPLKPAPFAPLTQVAPIEVRDAIYRAMIALCPATRYAETLIAGHGGLAERGFKLEHYPRYGALPAAASLRDQLAAAALRLVKKRYAEFKSFAHVPGLWKDQRGLHLWKLRDYRNPRLLIPYYDAQGRIQALQMRRVQVAEGELRYLWLSSDNQPGGVSSGTPLHYTYRAAELPADALIVLVEGGLKSQAFVAQRPRAYALATPSVNTSHPEIIEATRGRKLLLGFDQDYHTNPNVCRHLASLLSQRTLSEGTAETTRIAVWDHVKGIDDAVLAEHQITMLSLLDWRLTLTAEMRALFDQHWREARQQTRPQPLSQEDQSGEQRRDRKVAVN